MRPGLPCFDKETEFDVTTRTILQLVFLILRRVHVCLNNGLTIIYKRIIQFLIRPKDLILFTWAFSLFYD